MRRELNPAFFNLRRNKMDMRDLYNQHSSPLRPIYITDLPNLDTLIRNHIWQGLYIRTIDWHQDSRTGDIFAVTFHTTAPDPVHFHVGDSGNDLYSRVVDWLSNID